MRVWASWIPAGLLAGGALLVSGVRDQVAVPLRSPLDATLPVELEGLTPEDLRLPEEEVAVAGVSSYVLRAYPHGALGGEAAFSVYAGYYDSQRQGKTIHSPRNCLPGAGWEVLSSGRAELSAGDRGRVSVNRYLIGAGDARAVVLYWYQGRGRIEANEYVVKWNLLRDAALLGRTEEALVRIVVPVWSSEEASLAQAVRIAEKVVPAMFRALPGM